MGQKLDDYEIVDLLGVGRFGTTFEAVDASAGTHVALKVLTPTTEPAILNEFAREGDLLRRLQDVSNVVDWEKSSGTTLTMSAGPEFLSVPVPLRYHVLELATGCLEELVENRQHLSWPERLRLWRGVTLGVHQMHLRKVVHRDLKSSNCLIFLEPKNKISVKVADLGRSRLLTAPPIARPLEYMVGRGDFRFAPPELLWWQGEDDGDKYKLADLYGLGSVLFELATGLGITSHALGPTSPIIDQAYRDMVAGRRSDLSGLRSLFDESHILFANLVPSVIRDRASNLLRQLCDPVPERRRPTMGIEGRSSRHQGLEWLLRQADILIKTASVDSRAAKRRYQRNEKVQAP